MHMLHTIGYLDLMDGSGLEEIIVDNENTAGFHLMNKEVQRALSGHSIVDH